MHCKWKRKRKKWKKKICQTICCCWKVIATQRQKEKEGKNATIKCSLCSLIPQINENTTVHVGVVATFVAISSMHKYYSQINSFSHTHTHLARLILQQIDGHSAFIESKRHCDTSTSYSLNYIYSFSWIFCLFYCFLPVACARNVRKHSIRCVF